MWFRKKARSIDEQPLSVVNNENAISDLLPLGELTKSQLVDIANESGVSITSKMTKEEIYNKLIGGEK